MALHQLAGYPMVVAVSQKIINQQYELLAHYGVFPTTWSLDGQEGAGPESVWILDVQKMATPYITVANDNAQEIYLNFKVVEGTFSYPFLGSYNPITHSADIKDGKISLNGVVFQIVTPVNVMKLDLSQQPITSMPDSVIKTIVPQQNLFSPLTLYYDLDHPTTKTTVLTNKVLNTVTIAGIQTTAARQITSYIRSIASQAPSVFSIISNPHQLEAIKEAKSLACQAYEIQPNLTAIDAHVSIYKQFDNRYPADDPQFSANSTINWLLNTPISPSTNAVDAGRFNQSPLRFGGDAVLGISMYSLVQGVIVPMVTQALRVPESCMNVQENGRAELNTNPPWANGFTLTKVKIDYVDPAKQQGTDILIHYEAHKEKSVMLSKIYFKLTWTSRFKFEVTNDGILSIAIENSPFKPEVHGSDPFSELAVKFAEAIKGQPTPRHDVSGFNNHINQMIRSIGLVGRQDFRYANAHFKPQGLFIELKLRD